jgi:hypothetical protein
MKFYCFCLIGFIILMELSACDSSGKQEQLKSTPTISAKPLEKKLQKGVEDSIERSNFTTANTSGNFSEGQGSEKKKSTEKPNRKRVSQDLTHPFQTSDEFVDETSDPAFNYSSPNECEIILTDTVQ